MKKFFLIVFAAMLVFAFTLPAHAAKVKMSAVLIFDAAWAKTDSGYQQNMEGNAHDDGWNGLNIGISPLGWFGVQISDKNVGVRANVCPRGRDNNVPGEAASNEVSKLREFYGWWQVNPAFKLVVGQINSLHSNLSPGLPFAANLADASGSCTFRALGLGAGNIWPRRHPQIQGNFTFSPNISAQLAFINPETPKWSVVDAGPIHVSANASKSDETTLPRIDLTLTLKFGRIFFEPSYSYTKKTYEWDQFYGAGTTWGDSYVTSNFALPVKVSLGAYTLMAELNTGENWGSGNFYYQGATPKPATDRVVIDSTGKFHNTKCLGYWAEVNYKFGKFTPGIVYGHQEVENKGLPAADAANRFENERNMFGVYLNIAATPHWFITPFWEKYDFGDLTIDGVKDGKDYGSYSFHGVNFIIAF